jgi:carbonic anhydrase
VDNDAMKGCGHDGNHADNHDAARRADRRTLLKLLAGTAAGAALLPAGRAHAKTERPSKPAPATPDEAIAALKAGNERFVKHTPQVRDTAEIEDIWTEISAGQAPFATVLGCADSRLAPELIFDQFFGDVFVVREAGNIADSPTNLGSLEYGQAVLGSKLILVLGHSSCGAVKAAFENATPGGNIQSIVDAIKPGITGAKTLEDATTANVRAVIARIREKSPLLKAAETAGKIKIVGGVYTIANGTVTWLEA